MNVENSNRPLVGQPDTSGVSAVRAGCDGEATSAVAKPALVGAGLLSVRAAPRDPAAEAVRRTEPAGPADDLKPDALDALVKSVLDFPPPPLPNFGIMSQDSS